MLVTVQLFAGAREAAGVEQIEVSLDPSAEFSGLAAALQELCPKLAPLLKNARFASNTHYVCPSDPIDPTAEIALIPPVSGG